MARMYSRKRGKASSKKPLKRTVPSWVVLKPTEVEMLVAKMAKEGFSASKIGLTLRDKYGLPDVKAMCGKTITKLLKEKNVLPELPEDITALIKKSAAVQKHLEENRHDQTAKRGLTLTESKIKRLIKYYKLSGRIPEDWKYDVSRAGYFLE